MLSHDFSASERKKKPVTLTHGNGFIAVTYLRLVDSSCGCFAVRESLGRNWFLDAALLPCSTSPHSGAPCGGVTAVLPWMLRRPGEQIRHFETDIRIASA